MSTVPQAPDDTLSRILVQRKDGKVRIVVRTPGKGIITVKQMPEPRHAGTRRRAKVGTVAFADRLTHAFGQAVAAAARESRKVTESTP